MIYGTNIPFAPEIPMPDPIQVKKESKIKRVYEDDTWVIDLIDGNVRISYFEDNHYMDEVTIYKDTLRGWNNNE